MEDDSLRNLLREWKAPEAPPAMDARDALRVSGGLSRPAPLELLERKGKLAGSRYLQC